MFFPKISNNKQNINKSTRRHSRLRASFRRHQAATLAIEDVQDVADKRLAPVLEGPEELAPTDGHDEMTAFEGLWNNDTSHEG